MVLTLLILPGSEPCAEYAGLALLSTSVRHIQGAISVVDHDTLVSAWDQDWIHPWLERHNYTQSFNDEGPSGLHLPWTLGIQDDLTLESLALSRGRPSQVTGQWTTCRVNGSNLH